jgi:Domain of unknown function (DUF3402)
MVSSAQDPQQPPLHPPTLDEIDVTRHREITTKAVSAILLLTLKWFKVSRRFVYSIEGVHRLNDFRCHEVSSSRPTVAGYELSPTRHEDVWNARCINDSCLQSGFA